MVVALLVFCSNVLIVQALGTEFVPEGEPRDVTVVGELPAGTALEAADRAAKRWEMLLLDHDRFPEVHTAYVQVGREPRDSRPISITLDVGEPSTRDSAPAPRSVGPRSRPARPSCRRCGRVAATAAVAATTSRSRCGSSATTWTSSRRPPTPPRRRCAALPELADVTNSLTAAPEVTIRPDSQRLMDLGVNTQQIGTAVRVAYQGAEVGKWAEANGKERDVRVMLPADVRNRPDAVANLPLIQRGDRSWSP